MNLSSSSHKRKRKTLFSMGAATSHAMELIEHAEWGPQNLLRYNHYRSIVDGGWLQEIVAEQAQYLLSLQYPNMIRKWTYRKGDFHRTITANRCIEIVFDPSRLHFITIQRSHEEPGVTVVYDSIRTDPEEYHRSFGFELTNIRVHQGMPQQTNYDDCGLYAIAVCELLAREEKLATQQFDATKMRDHLYQCLLNGEMKPFPLLEDKSQGIS